VGARGRVGLVLLGFVEGFLLSMSCMVGKPPDGILDRFFRCNFFSSELAGASSKLLRLDFRGGVVTDFDGISSPQEADFSGILGFSASVGIRR